MRTGGGIPEAQREHRDQWRERFLGLASKAGEIDFQTSYPMFDLHEVAKILKGWVQDKKDDIMGYRNAVYRSVMTGPMATRHHTEWVQELDDSLGRYLSTPEPDEVREVVEGRVTEGSEVRK